MVPTAPAHVVIDCDPGIDDALALAVLAHHQRAGRVRVHGVIAVGGNVGLDHTAANARFLARRFGLEVPVLAGAATPLGGTATGDASEVHGADGLGGLGPAGRPTATSPDPLDALAALVTSMPTGEGDRVLLATGPLTDLALLLDHDPSVAEHRKK